MAPKECVSGPLKLGAHPSGKMSVLSATELAYWRLIDAYDYTYVTVNGAHNLTKVSPVTGNG